MGRRRGFTLVELSVVLLSVLAVVAALVIYVAANRRSSRAGKDQQQLQRIMQGLVLGASGGPDSYMLPSYMDRGNTTLVDDGLAAKDLPGHIMSLHIYNGFFPPEICVSPSETNPRIQVFKKYNYVNPAGAVTPPQALWDPAFRGTPDEDGVSGLGNLSYAMMPAVGARRAMWTNDFQANEAIIGNRGPAYVLNVSGARASWQLAPSRVAGAAPDTPVGVGSFSLGVHGAPEAWRGYVAYNDNHVSFENDASPAATPFTFSGLPTAFRQQPDNLFVNENDSNRTQRRETLEGEAGQNKNNFLRLWSNGKQREHTKEWWDAWKRGDPSSGSRNGELAGITPWYD